MPPQLGRARGEVSWFLPMCAVLALQVIAAFLTRIVPTLAPAVAVDFGWWTAPVIGYFTALGHFGTILFLVGGAGIINWTGPIRSLQIGLTVGLFGIVLLLAPSVILQSAACLLIGIAYGPSIPAGSIILQQRAPPRHRALFYSIKQSGVPIGGALAGLALPPIVEAAGWRLALVAAGIIAIATTVAVQPVRAEIDQCESNPASEKVTVRSGLLRSLQALRDVQGMATIAVVGACFAVAQSCWFAFLVIYLTSQLESSLWTAGVLFSLFQSTAIFGRLLLGWLADRLDSGLVVLICAAGASTLTTITLSLCSQSWPSGSVVLLVAVAGVTVSGWNGVLGAEVAKLAPSHLMGESVAGSAIITFSGYLVGPAIFSIMTLITQRLDSAFLVVSLTTIVPIFLLPKLNRFYKYDSNA